MATIKSSAENLTLNADGANNDIKFQSNGSEVAQIDQAGVISSTGGSTHADNVKAKFGTGNDLEIFHDGSHSNVRDVGTGQLRLQGSEVRINANATENSIKALANGAVELYHDDAKKFETTAAGITVTGGASIDGAVTINESGTDVDFRVESDGLTHALFVEGGNGRIGINTSSPAYPVHMVGDRLMTEVVDNSNTGIFMRVKNGGSQVGNATIRTNNNGDISIFQGTSSEALRATFKQAGGICFNADTAAANALDDYEKGAHECAITMGSGTATLDSTNRYLRYVKIGDQVTVSGQIQITAVSNPSGTFQISLPFTCSGAEADYSAGNYRTYGVTIPSDGRQAVIFADRGQAKANLEWTRSNAAPLNELANTGYYLIGLTYFTA